MSLSVILEFEAIDFMLSPKMSGFVHKIRINPNPVIEIQLKIIRAQVNIPVKYFKRLMKINATSIAINTQYIYIV